MTERLTKREYDGSVGISALRYYNYDDFQKMAKKLAHYEDLEEQGRIYTVEDDLFPLLQVYKPNQERCKATLGMTMEEASARFAKYQSLEEQNRLLVLPEGLDMNKFISFISYDYCVSLFGLKAICDNKNVTHEDCKKCWEKALKE